MFVCCYTPFVWENLSSYRTFFIGSDFLPGINCYLLPTSDKIIFSRWLPEPLSLAGIWNSPLLSVVVDTAAVDAAAAVEDGNTSPVAAAAGSNIRSLSQPVETNNSFYQLGLMNEDEALRLILGATPVR